MNKASGLIGQVLPKLGGSVFRFLSRCEESRFIPAVSRFLKVFVLGALVLLITSFCKKVDTDDKVMCYKVARLPDVIISDVEITPNPTQGAKKVTIKAEAKIQDTESDTSYISSATMQATGDSIRHEMKAQDGKLDDTLEILLGDIDVSGIEPCTLWVDIVTTTPLGGWGNRGAHLIITDQDDSD